MPYCASLTYKCLQLKNDKFDTLFTSPLKRSSKTGSIIWGSRQGNVVEMPSLREIDLYSFQVFENSLIPFEGEHTHHAIVAGKTVSFHAGAA